MTTKKNGQSNAASRRLAASVDPSGKLRIANKEKNYQQRLEKMQIALVSRDVRYKKTVARGLKELVNAKKMETLLSEHKIRPLSDYSHLKEIYDSDLKSITIDDLMLEAEAKAENFLTKGNKVTKAQEKMVRDLYELEARTNELGIDQVREFLIIKGEIKETPQDKKRLAQHQQLVEEEQAA